MFIVHLSLALAIRLFSHFKKCINFTAQHAFVVFAIVIKLMKFSMLPECGLHCEVHGLSFAIDMKHGAYENEKNDLSVSMQRCKV